MIFKPGKKPLRAPEIISYSASSLNFPFCRTKPQKHAVGQTWWPTPNLDGQTFEFDVNSSGRCA